MVKFEWTNDLINDLLGGNKDENEIEAFSDYLQNWIGEAEAEAFSEWELYKEDWM